MAVADIISTVFHIMKGELFPALLYVWAKGFKVTIKNDFRKCTLWGLVAAVIQKFQFLQSIKYAQNWSEKTGDQPWNTS